jgi:hypothetical protein
MVPSIAAWSTNVWGRMTVEDKNWAARRLPPLVEIPAVVRFVSCEPLIAGVDLTDWLARPDRTTPGLDWGIAGRESGLTARHLRDASLRVPGSWKASDGLSLEARSKLLDPVSEPDAAVALAPETCELGLGSKHSIERLDGAGAKARIGDDRAGKFPSFIIEGRDVAIERCSDDCRRCDRGGSLIDVKVFGGEGGLECRIQRSWPLGRRGKPIQRRVVFERSIAPRTHHAISTQGQGSPRKCINSR